MCKGWNKLHHNKNTSQNATIFHTLFKNYVEVSNRWIKYLTPYKEQIDEKNLINIDYATGDRPHVLVGKDNTEGRF